MQIRSDDVATILDICLERIQDGESIEACVLDYPSEAEELEPLLSAAIYARQTFQPPALAPEARQKIRRQMRRAVAARQPMPRRPIGWFRPLMRLALALMIALLSLGGGVAAAQSSLPGGSLYPLKRASEDVRLILAYSSTQRAALHLEFAAARSAELLQLANAEQHAASGSLVDDLEQEYQLAWQEIEIVPAGEVHDLASRYGMQRQADVTVFSAALAHANIATSVQIQRALRLGKQALAGVAPAELPVPQSILDGTSTGGNAGNHQDQGSQENPVGVGNSHSNGASVSDGKPAETGPKGTPKTTPEGKPAETGPKDTPKATPEGKPAETGPKDTPKATPEGKPADAGPPATPEGKPDNGGGKPDDAKPANGRGKPDSGDSKPKPGKP